MYNNLDKHKCRGYFYVQTQHDPVAERTQSVSGQKDHAHSLLPQRAADGHHGQGSDLKQRQPGGRHEKNCRPGGFCRFGKYDGFVGGYYLCCS